MLFYIGWRVNEILMPTNQGLYLWTRSAMTKEDPPHIFRSIHDNELWEWGL